jgi:hypothetical protein
MHSKMAVVAICIAALAMSAAAQVTGSGTSGTVPVFTGTSTVGNSPIAVSGSNVGIGTTAPQATLDVSGSIRSSSGFNYGAAAGNQWWLAGTQNGPSIMMLQNGGVGGTSYRRGSLGWMNNNGGASEVLTWTGDTGNVGIGTTSPDAKLEVSGSVKLSSGSGGSITFQDGTTQSTAYTGVTCGGDYAESVDVTGKRTNYEPGDVLVIDSSAPGKFLKSDGPYSTAVMGVYSTKPGTVGRRQTTPKSDDEVPMAMIGIVPIKVSAESGTIRPGDLLVTSSIPGYAMKGNDRSRMLGAVIGKALGNLDSGTGVIEVGVTLQ